MPILRFRLLACAAVCAGLLMASVAAAQTRLIVTVIDESGGGIPGASVIVLADGAMLDELTTEDRGRVNIPLRGQASLHLVVTTPGFETAEQDVPIVAGREPDPVTITLAIARITDEVVVAGTAPEPGGSSESLSDAQLDALPDDEASLQQLLEDLAGPGAEIRVDGFTGQLPRKEDILRVTVRRDAYSAEMEQPGRGRVEILTRPNAEIWRGNGSVQYRPSGLAANNALARQTPSGTFRSISGSIGGPLVKNKTALFFRGDTRNGEESRAIQALTLDGPFLAAVDQPSDEYRLNLRLESMLSQSTLMRLTWSGDQESQDNQGLSALDLPERGYEQRSTEHSVRLSVDGGVSMPYYVRVRGEIGTDKTIPDTIARAIVVNDGFRGGGATRNGEDKSQSANLESAITLLTRPTYNLRAGGELDWSRNTQGVLQNTLGTFTFLDLESYAAGRPATFVQRVGAQVMPIEMLQGALFMQADITLPSNWSLGIGTRYQLQTHMRDYAAVSPRLGISKSMNDGRTTIRGGYGWYYGWLPTNVWEENLRLSRGSTEQEIIINNPGYPNPTGEVAATEQQPPSLVSIPRDAEMTRWARASLGVGQRFGAARVNVDVFHLSTSSDWRAIDTNAPVDGVRPDRTHGRTLLVDSIGKVTETGWSAGIGFFANERFANIRYSWSRRWSDGDSALTPPPDGRSLEGEWAPSGNDPGHRLFWSVGVPVGWGVQAALFGRIQQGSRYNVTTGLDANGDAYFIERPVGVERNSERGSAMVTTDLRLSWRPALFGGPTRVSEQRGPGGRGGPRGGGRRGGGRNRQMEIYLSATNLFNRVNYTNFVGVQSSRLFGTGTSARAARRVELGWRMSF